MKKLLVTAVAVLALGVGAPTLNACGEIAYQTTTHFIHHVYQCIPAYPAPICADWFEERGTLYEECDGSSFCDGDCDPAHAAWETYDFGRQCFCEPGPENP